MFYTFTLVLSPQVPAQGPTWLLSVGPWFRTFSVCCSGCCCCYYHHHHHYHQKYACLFWILLVFKFFLILLEIPPLVYCYLQKLCYLDVFRLTVYVKMLISLGHPLLLKNEFCANLWHFDINISMFIRGFDGVCLLLQNKTPFFKRNSG